MANTKVAGVDVLVSVNTGTTATPIWTVVGGQGDATLNRSAEEIDVSAKTDPGGYGDSLAGKKMWSVECSGFLVEDDTAFDLLETNYEDRLPVMIQIAMPSGKKYSGTARITDFPLEFPKDDGASFSITLSGSGALVITPATP